MSKFRSVQETKIPFEYNKNIASRSKHDLAFRVHHHAWLSEITQENLARDPYNVNALLQRLSIETYNQLKATSQRGVSRGL